MHITVQRGSGIAGHQYATISFTNTGHLGCPLTGYPRVQLLAGASPVGTSVNSTEVAGTVVLKPGTTASAALVNDSTCGALTSDSVQVTAPRSGTVVKLPLTFRACTVTVGPVTTD